MLNKKNQWESIQGYIFKANSEYKNIFLVKNVERWACSFHRNVNKIKL